MVLMTYAVDPETLSNFVRLTSKRAIPPELPDVILPDNIAIGPKDNFGNIRRKVFRATNTFLTSRPEEVEPGKWLWKETALLPIIALSDVDYQRALRHTADVIRELEITAVRGYYFRPREWNGNRRLWLPPYWFTDAWPPSLIHGIFEDGYWEWEVRTYRKKRKDDSYAAEENKVVDD